MPNDFTTALPADFIPDESDEVLQDLSVNEEEFAFACALYDRNGTWEHNRKILLAELREQYRATFAARGEKITESRLDDLAHADAKYRDFIRISTDAKTQYHVQVAKRIAHYTRLRTLSHQGMR